MTPSVTRRDHLTERAVSAARSTRDTHRHQILAPNRGGWEVVHNLPLIPALLVDSVFSNILNRKASQNARMTWPTGGRSK